MSLVLELDRWFPAPPDRVFSALTDIYQLRRWYTCDPRSRWHFHQWDAEVGGALAVTIEAPGITVAVRGRFVEVVPAKRLAYDWNEEFIELDLVSVNDGTQVSLTHHQLADDAERRIRDEGWSHNFASLTDHLTDDEGARP